RLWASPVTSRAWVPDAATGDIAGSLAVHGDDVYLQGGSGASQGQDLLISRNEGESFTASPNVGYGLPCHFSPVTEQVIWGTCATGMQAGGIISTDGGRTFRAANLGGQCANSSQIAGASATVAVGICADGQSVSIERTTDGGNTFVPVEPPPGPTGLWVLAGFTNPSDGYAFWSASSGGESLWHTTDGGAHWSMVILR
ncbi:MAG: WD40/YVTN/BNR-like repeat-containing protein, partial [Candidatus Dormibacteria bacterium]